METNLFVKGNSLVCLNSNNDFIYESFVKYHGKNYFSVVNSGLYRSDVELKKLVKTMFLSKKIEISTDLVEAPLSWLIDNGYKQYFKPLKKVKLKN